MEGDQFFACQPEVGIQIYRLTNGRPGELLGTIPCGSVADEISVADDLVYAGGGAGLVIYDISNAAMPQHLSTYGLPMADVEVQGDLAYSIGTGIGLAIIYVGDPVAPVYTGTVVLPSPTHLAMQGSTAYVRVADEQIVIVDCSVPYAPVVVGQWAQPGPITGMEVAGDRLFVLHQYAGVYVYDLASPASPYLIAHVELMPYCLDIDAAGDVVCVAVQSRGVAVIDNSGPATPHLIGLVAVRDEAERIVITGNHVVTRSTDWTADLADVVDISARTVLAPAAQISLPVDPLALATREELVYVANGESGLTIVDAVDPVHPVTVGALDTPGTAVGVAVEGQTAWLASLSNGLQAIDVTDPGAPSLSGALDVEGMVVAVAASDHLVFAGVQPPGVLVVDGADPGAPIVVGSIQVPTYVAGVAVDGSYLFVAASSAGLLVFDVSRPEASALVGACGGEGWYLDDLAVNGGLALLLDRGQAVHVVDVVDPAAPAWLVSLSGPFSFMGTVAIRGEIGLVAGRDLCVLDLANPGEPWLVGSVGGISCAVVGADEIYGLASTEYAGRLLTLPPPCGLDPVAVQIWGFAAQSTADGVRIEWVQNLDPGCEVRVRGERDDDAGGAWTVPFTLGADGVCRACDISPATRYPGIVEYRVEVRNGTDDLWREAAATAIEMALPDSRRVLASAYPNPFNPRMTLEFSLPSPGYVTIAVFDSRGREVVRLLDEARSAGLHAVDWTGLDAGGRSVASGIYFCRLTTPWGVETRKLSLVR